MKKFLNQILCFLFGCKLQYIADYETDKRWSMIKCKRCNHIESFREIKSKYQKI